MNTGQERDAGLSVSASYTHQFDTDIGRSGEFRLDRALVRSDWKRKVSETVTLGVGANYDYSSYSFTGRFNDHIADPWDEVHALNALRMTASGWFVSMMVSPSWLSVIWSTFQ